LHEGCVFRPRVGRRAALAGLSRLLEISSLLIKGSRAVYVVPEVLELENSLSILTGRSYTIDRFTKSNQKTCSEWSCGSQRGSSVFVQVTRRKVEALGISVSLRKNDALA
jgi:hypothetical protein